MFIPIDKYEYYRFLNYPQLPESIVSYCMDKIYEYKSENDKNSTFGLSKYNRLAEIPQCLTDFCATHLADTEFTNILVQWFDNGFSIPAHRDHIYDQQINYYISYQSTPTSFYEPIANFQYYDIRGKYVDMKDLIEVDSIIFPRNTWILFNAMSLHGVKEIDGLRAMISLKLPHKFE